MRTRPTSPPAGRPAREQSWVAPEWGWAWPANRRILYNRASADPAGRPWSERKSYVWWDERTGIVDGRGRAGFRARQAPGLRPTRRSERAGRDRRRHAVHHAGGRPGLAVRTLRRRRRPAARRTTSRTSRRSKPAVRAGVEPRAAAFRPARKPQQRTRRPGRIPLRRDHLPADRASHGRRHEPVPARISSELQPEMFCEVSPELAAERRLVHGGWATITSRRASIEARVLVTRRLKPMPLGGRRRAPGRAAVPLGHRTASRAETRPTTCSRSCSTRTCTSRSRRPPPATSGRGGGTGGDRAPRHGGLAAELRRRGAGADRLLHRHQRLHRLQGVRGRLQGVESRPRGRARLHR